ncbi:PREDICTED: brain-specific angiogenesis inhibitor 1-associated protein 2-like isoform X2 [Branchiostoma belcheri]|uniref:BAR/IMD domain-containing adapter protein 2-like 1 n=1 Tax=Branchiostoma belcheri TaxID=7741 RepID=A0A6P5A6Z6_BRABE|nr:PREDICTED: brain-specific angiogenesis inhibitor 1-associated protein 2-like isoform X2 [Branchiostoma belcheri]
MARVEEAHRITDLTYKGLVENFAPAVRNLISMGKAYEKSLAAVSSTARGYFEALMKLGEQANATRGAPELGGCLIQIAEIFRNIQMQHEETVQSFHKELIVPLEQKVEQDSRSLPILHKTYTQEYRAKSETFEKAKSDLKKHRKKSNRKDPHKYEAKESQLIRAATETQSKLDDCRAHGLTKALVEERKRYCFVVDRHCAIVKHYMVYHSKAQNLLRQKLDSWVEACDNPNILTKRAQDLLDRALQGPSADMMTMTRRGSQGMLDSDFADMNGGRGDPYLRDDRYRGEGYSRDGFATMPERRQGSPLRRPISPVSQHAPLQELFRDAPPPVPAQHDVSIYGTMRRPAPQGRPTPQGRPAPQGRPMTPQGRTMSSSSWVGPKLDYYQAPRQQQQTTIYGTMRGPPRRPSTFQDDRYHSPPPNAMSVREPRRDFHEPLMVDTYSNTLPNPRRGQNQRQPRPSQSASVFDPPQQQAGQMTRSVSAVPASRRKVRALFPHKAGDSSNQLSFNEGDTISLLIDHPRDGWHFGENDKTKRRGWFPYSYTQPAGSDGPPPVQAAQPMPAPLRPSVSMGNLLNNSAYREPARLPSPDYQDTPGVALSPLRREARPRSVAGDSLLTSDDFRHPNGDYQQPQGVDPYRQPPPRSDYQQPQPGDYRQPPARSDYQQPIRQPPPPQEYRDRSDGYREPADARYIPRQSESSYRQSVSSEYSQPADHRARGVSYGGEPDYRSGQAEYAQPVNGSSSVSNDRQNGFREGGHPPPSTLPAPQEDNPARNPFANVKLKKTVTNDRSAPII